MHKFELREKVKLMYEKRIELPVVLDSKESCHLLFERGAEGVISGLTETRTNQSYIQSNIRVSFDIGANIVLVIENLTPNDIC